jgi:hypothetical protein
MCYRDIESLKVHVLPTLVKLLSEEDVRKTSLEEKTCLVLGTAAIFKFETVSL